jgi:hypothetical protein
MPTGAGNTNMSLRQILRVLRIANGDESKLKNTIRRTLMVDCLPNHMKTPINEVLGSICVSEASSINQSAFEISHSQACIRYLLELFPTSFQNIATGVLIFLFAELATSH